MRGAASDGPPGALRPPPRGANMPAARVPRNLAAARVVLRATRLPARVALRSTDATALINALVSTKREQTIA